MKHLAHYFVLRILLRSKHGGEKNTTCILAYWYHRNTYLHCPRTSQVKTHHTPEEYTHTREWYRREPVQLRNHARILMKYVALNGVKKSHKTNPTAYMQTRLLSRLTEQNIHDPHTTARNDSRCKEPRRKNDGPETDSAHKWAIHANAHVSDSTTRDRQS